jgi:hypothetical protein
VDSAGTVHLAYGHRPKGPFRRSLVRYAQAPPDSAFTTPLALSGRPAAHAASAGFPSLELGPAGAVVVLWELFPTVQGRPRALGYTRSADGGTTFGRPAVVTFGRPAVVPGSDADGQGFNGSQQGLLMDKLAVTAPGAVAVVNSTFRPGEHSRVRLYRGRLAGP